MDASANVSVTGCTFKNVKEEVRLCKRGNQFGYA